MIVRLLAQSSMFALLGKRCAGPFIVGDFDDYFQLLVCLLQNSEQMQETACK